MSPFQYFREKMDKEDISNSTETKTFAENVHKFHLNFSYMMVELLDQINELGRDSSNDRLFNLLYRYVFNRNYSPLSPPFLYKRRNIFLKNYYYGLIDFFNIQNFFVIIFTIFKHLLKKYLSVCLKVLTVKLDIKFFCCFL